MKHPNPIIEKPAPLPPESVAEIADQVEALLDQGQPEGIAVPVEWATPEVRKQVLWQWGQVFRELRSRRPVSIRSVSGRKLGIPKVERYWLIYAGDREDAPLLEVERS